MMDARNSPLSFLSAALAVLMLATLGVATIRDMVDGPGSPRDEAVAKTPDVSLSLRALKKLPGDARHYLANRYALKEQFIDLDAWVKYRLLEREWTREVIVGGDGFLFLRNAEAIGQAQGAYRSHAEEKAAWAAQFSRMRQAFAERDVPFVFLIAPNKHSIYADRLPGWIGQLAPEENLTDQIVAAAVETGAFRAPNIENLLGAVRTASDGQLLYHRTDTHWTEYGAALALAHALMPVGFDLAPPLVVQHGVGRGGDLSRLTGWRPDPTDPTPSITRSPSVSCLDGDQPYDLQTIDPLPIKQFTCRNDQAKYGDVLVFMDSFGVSAAPTFANAFRTSRFFWRDSVDLSIVDAVRPDLVVQIIVERKIPNLRPASLMRSNSK